MDVRTTNLSYLSMIIQYISVQFRQFAYALQQANNPRSGGNTYIEAGPGYLQFLWDNHEGPIYCCPMPHTWWMRDPTHLDGYDHWSLEEVLQEAKEFFVGVEERTESIPLLCDMDQIPSETISWLIESCDEMIHGEEVEICQLHGVDKYRSSLRTSGSIQLLSQEPAISRVLSSLHI
ncbi:hypothetical protein F5J12DRAFT_780509 [Pisolithus orientalis]|uniref:uncharacterized protein n=1 Tax=Pisolithus orientalis TaxID=936130 RepID=UPI0022249D40|nr:uncharacterized protein F5J12DRAFT_780509 [Pisolithus orientalis]KAI6025671.1 hypothetical protein F5J12DRAFT_780509 [Pisolithus orientalis]